MSNLVVKLFLVVILSIFLFLFLYILFSMLAITFSEFLINNRLCPDVLINDDFSGRQLGRNPHSCTGFGIIGNIIALIISLTVSFVVIRGISRKFSNVK